MNWQPRYSKAIEKKLFALRCKLAQAGASEAEIARQSAACIAAEQAKAQARKRQRLARKIAEMYPTQTITKTVDSNTGDYIIRLLDKTSGVVVQQTVAPLQSLVWYSWAFYAEMDCMYSVENFTFEGANRTNLCGILPNSYILVLDKLNKNGKKCGKLYVDMFFKALVKV